MRLLGNNRVSNRCFRKLELSERREKRALLFDSVSVLRRAYFLSEVRVVLTLPALLEMMTRRLLHTRRRIAGQRAVHVRALPGAVVALMDNLLEVPVADVLELRVLVDHRDQLHALRDEVVLVVVGLAATTPAAILIGRSLVLALGFTLTQKRPSRCQFLCRPQLLRLNRSHISCSGGLLREWRLKQFGYVLDVHVDDKVGAALADHLLPDVRL